MKFPTFEEFYQDLDRAVRGADAADSEPRSPFPWQNRLASHLDAGNDWFDEIGVPTGTGKTTCLDIAVWWLASQAHRPPVERTAPTRIWWVVNRRMLIDSTAEHADLLARQLSEKLGSETHLGAVADRLASLSPNQVPLEVVRLRGGAAMGRPSDPAQPAVVLATIPMYGSRLLFRGYGVSRSMRPVDAALAGTDSLVLVDEAHLAQHLMDLMPDLHQCDRITQSVLPSVRIRPRVVSLTATGDQSSDRRLDLNREDLDVEALRMRVLAHKPITLDEANSSSQVPVKLAEAALSFVSDSPSPVACVVFANSPATAIATAERLLAKTSSIAHEPEVVVLTGRMRTRESEAARARLLSDDAAIRSGADRSRRTRSIIAVATQTLEVGADLDFDHLVTEACGRRALIQRLGRLNRLGSNDSASGVYLHTPPSSGSGGQKHWGLYGIEPAEIIDTLRAAAIDGDHVDLGPLQTTELLGPPNDHPGTAPAVLPSLLWEWVKTSRPPTTEAPVEPYFSGHDDRQLVASVCWRAWLPTGPVDTRSSEIPVWPRVTEDECIDIPLQALREFIGDSQVMVLAGDRSTYRPVDGKKVTPGATVLLRTDQGGYDQHGWNPLSTAPVLDVSLFGAGMPLDNDVLHRWTGVDRKQIAALLKPIAAADEEGILLGVEGRALLLDLLRALVTGIGNAIGSADHPLTMTAPDWARVGADLDRHADQVPLARWLRVVQTASGGPTTQEPMSESPSRIEFPAARRVLLDATDDLSAGWDVDAAARELPKHGKEVGKRARELAGRLGLPEALVDDLALAAELHDIGKADLRFQLWLDPDGDSVGGVPLAKSNRPWSAWEADRKQSGWPAGGRHEALSARLASVWLGALETETGPNDPELVLHLIGSHHGHGRPLIDAVADAGGPAVSTSIRGAQVSASADLSTTDWDQPARFHALTKRYGHWGLPLLEALLRQADHEVSRRLVDPNAASALIGETIG